MTDKSTAVDRPEPPALDWQPPLCPICGNETSHHGYYPAACATVWACEACRATWRIEPGCEGDPGQWMDPGEPQCRSEGRCVAGVRPIAARCLLGENHVDSRDTRDHKGISADGRHMVWGANPWVKEAVPAAPKAERDARTAERARSCSEARRGAGT